MNKVLYKKALKYDVITFDLFDTLIKRNVGAPADVFRLIQLKYVKQYPELKCFAIERMEAEKNAFKASGGTEVTLDEIYAWLKYAPCLKEKLRKKEIETEMQVCVPQKDMLQLYNKLLNEGKTIYIISDMYLPEDVIHRLCGKTQINGYRRLYVSSSYGCRKRTGKLFNIFLEREGLDKKKVLHIGDNFFSDVLGAGIAGINSYYVKNSDRVRYLIKSGTIAATVSDAIINNNLSLSDEDIYYKYGFCLFGPLLYSFCRWIYDQAQRNHLNKILFIARDGYIIQKAFQQLYGEVFDCKYLGASRSSVMCTKLENDFNIKSLISSITDKKMIAIDGIINAIDIPGGQIDLLYQKYGISKNVMIETTRQDYGENIM